MYKKIVLDNGVSLATAFMPNHTSCSCGIWFNAGGRYENENNSGISHFIEHLAFKGSKKYSCERIKNLIEGKGGSLNAFTSEELTCYYAKVLAKDTFRTLEILADMSLNPLFKNRDIEKERTVIIEEIKMHKDLPQSYVLEILDSLLWPDQALGRSLTGTVQTVSSFRQKDFLDYHRSIYTGANITVAVAGNIDADKVASHVSKIFSCLKKSSKNHFLKSRAFQNKKRFSALDKPIEQTHIALGFHGLSRSDKMRYCLGVLHVILGANMSSRLFKRIREKHGLAYAISSHIRYFKDSGTFFIHAGLDNRTTEKAISLILAELRDLKKNLVNESEFKRAKDFLKGQLLMGFESTVDNMLWIGESTASMGKILKIQEVLDKLEKVTRADVRNLAKKIFRPEKENLAVIGPESAKLKDKIY